MDPILSSKLKEARVLIGDNQSAASRNSGILQKDISLMESGKRKYVDVAYLVYLLSNNIDLNSLFNEQEALRTIRKNDEGLLEEQMKIKDDLIKLQRESLALKDQQIERLKNRQLAGVIDSE